MSVSRTSTRSHALALVAIVGVMLLQALYAVRLNADFYKDHAPFYDSCSYTNQLADIAFVARTEGFRSGIKASLSGNVALPWLEMTALAKVAEPSRFLGVWLQSLWLTLLALSVYWYLVRYRAVPAWLGFCLTLPFVSFARIYYWNGGLQDFRMDLSLYIFTSLCLVWYLATYETGAGFPWLLSGTAAMLACLSRATAPVYLILMLAPLLAIRFWNARGRRRALAAHCAWMGVPIVFAVGAFLIYNFHYLYFYYVTWNPDANRHLPWSQSYPHLLMTIWHVGYVMVECSLAAFVLNFLMGLPNRIRQIDWKLVWLAEAAPLFLFFRGAGLNPFVSMPAVFGSLLFAYLPFRGDQPAFHRGWARVSIGVLAAAASIFNVVASNRQRPYVAPSTTSMAGFKAVVEQMNRDASLHGLRRIEYIAPEIGDFNSGALANVLIYEYGAMPGRDGALHAASGLAYEFPQEAAFTPAAEVQWKLDVPGSTDEEKMANLVSMAPRLAEYLLLPDEATVDWLERNLGFNYANLKTRELKARLLATGGWVRLGDAAAPSPHESIEVYARRTR